MVPSSFAVPNSKVSGFGDLEPFAAMSVSMPATLAAFAGAATSLAPSSRLSVSLVLKGGRVASLLEALCGLVDPGAQAAAAATVAVFSVDAFKGMLIMLPEGCVPGAVAGSARPLSSWSVVDAGAAAAAAKHETASVLKQVNGTAAASCPVAAAAALLGLFTVCDGPEIDNAVGLIASVDDIDQMNGAAAAQFEFVMLWFAALCLLAAAAAAFLSVSAFLCSWFPGFWSFGETDRLLAMSSISGPGINAFSWGRGCKGMLKNKEREVFASFSSTVTHGVQVTSYGTLAENFWAPVPRHLWKERHQFFINCNDVRDAVVESELVAKAAAALQGTCSSVHSGPWEAQHKVQPVQFFVKGKAGSSTSVVRGCLEEVLSQVVGTDGLDVYVTMNGKILDLCSTLKSCGITDGCTVHVHFRLRGGSREDVPGQWTCSQCFAPRCWPVRKRCYRCGAARDDAPVSAKVKGNGKADVTTGPLGRKPPQTASSVPPTTRRPQVVPPRGPPGAGVGSPPPPETPPSPPPEELVKALQLLQCILTPEDFSKYEKKLGPPKQQERVKLRERELLEAVERQANYEKQEQKHLEMIEKHEHNLAQQKKMLESVRSQLAEVRDTVGALRALVSETKEPPINSIVPPLPPPREPPPPLVTEDVLPTLGRAQDFLPLDSSYTQIDLDTDMEDEPGLTQSKSSKKRVLMKLKSSSSSGRRETVKYEASSGKDLARALAKLSPGGMNEFVQSVPVNVAGFLMRSAAQSAPLRLWPTEIDSQDADNIRGGPAAIETCG